MMYLYALTAACLLLSLAKSPAKTRRAIEIAGKKFREILFPFMVMLILVSLVTTLLTPSVIAAGLGGSSRLLSTAIAALLGSLTVLPGFVAFPFCALLLKQGVSYMTIAAFSTTLMMVGVVSFPVERNYLGTRAALIRNLVSLVIAIIIAASVGLIYGELN